jgi:hypothetical protein
VLAYRDVRTPQGGAVEVTGKNTGALIGNGRYYGFMTVDDVNVTGTMFHGQPGTVQKLSGRQTDVVTMPLATVTSDESALYGENGRSDEEAALYGEKGNGGDGAPEVVLGAVAPGTREVRVTWSDGTTTYVRNDKKSTGPRLVEVEGVERSWFVLPEPEGLSYESVKVTKPAT